MSEENAKSAQEDAVARVKVLEEHLGAIERLIRTNLHDNGTDIDRMKIGDDWHTGPVVDSAFRILRGLQQIAAAALSERREP